MSTRTNTRNELLEHHEKELMRIENIRLAGQISEYREEISELKAILKEEREIIRSLLRNMATSSSKADTRTDININK